MEQTNYEQPQMVNGNQVDSLNGFFRKVYSYMALALLVSGVTAYIGVRFFAVQIATIFSNTMASLVLFAIFMGMVVLFNKKVYDNPGAAFGMLMGFAVLNGATLAVIGLTVQLSVIGAAFFSTAFLYVGMAAYGYFTKRSLASMGSFLFGALIALIVAQILNMFFFNSLVYMIASVAGVIIFALMTAYDMNTIKQAYVQYAESGTPNAKYEQSLAVSGALSLYLDFINMFMYIVRLFAGSSRD